MANYLARIAAAGAAARSPVKPPVSGPPVLPPTPADGPAPDVEGRTALSDSFVPTPTDRSGVVATDSIEPFSSPSPAQPTRDSTSTHPSRPTDTLPEGRARPAFEDSGERSAATRRQQRSTFRAGLQPEAGETSVGESSAVVRLPRTLRRTGVGDTFPASRNESSVSAVARFPASQPGAEPSRPENEPNWRGEPEGSARTSGLRSAETKRSNSAERGSAEPSIRRTDTPSIQFDPTTRRGSAQDEPTAREPSERSGPAITRPVEARPPARPPIEPLVPIRQAEPAPSSGPGVVKLTIGRVDVQVVHAPARPPMVRRASAQESTPIDGLERRNLERFRLI